ncbi:hypothetical protein BBROOKSOX_1044 [Bathymodiolus brooksi thiotrophic gill symbiont]|nr:hypothetical protein BBROOKSOX_1044 [Bathymodiolus brooksi thiotrophic gill symbiont]
MIYLKLEIKQKIIKKKPRFHGAFFFVYLLNKSAFPSD